jgi:hypothetical protein
MRKSDLRNRVGTAVLAIPCLLRGGTEVQTLQLVRVLGEAEEAKAETLKAEMLNAVDGGRRAEDGNGGYTVTLVCYFQSDPEVVAEFQAAGAKVRFLNLDRALPAWRVVAALRRVFREERPDVVHVQYMAPGLLPRRAAVRSKKRAFHP